MLKGLRMLGNLGKNTVVGLKDVVVDKTVTTYAKTKIAIAEAKAIAENQAFNDEVQSKVWEKKADKVADAIAKAEAAKIIKAEKE